MSNVTSTEQRLLRDAFGCFATGITVVTADLAGKPVGITVNSFSSVSLEPPMISWCIDKQASLYSLFERTEFFSVNVLSAQQLELCRLFSLGRKEGFDHLNWRRGVKDIPLLADCVANFQCQTVHRYPGGDHSILVGEVLACDISAGEPLIFFNGEYRQLNDSN